ncbi:hypothetical protein LFYK43_08110 [Ligilactobacillus salitolerans]|uniref:Uncharacterized protein n=1 Tax=Ligilactobacillus salitolerans TaxID=1808352 RepID=A0A401IS35_9LACO|nr:hypothetical protein [Ligilactobacillus salitolerans]GBG94352.1 hypothetical protein LFYK43_08110 [Ligilactobacillus salitolerans]
MSEDVFFNPGQSISSDYDFNKAYVAAQIYHNKSNKPVLVVQESDGNPYFIFDEEAFPAAENAKTKYSVIKRIK